MRALIALLLLAAVGTGCGRSVGPPTPPHINYGQDTCARCTMILEEPRCAAAVKPEEGDAVVFDDISDMLHWLGQSPDRRVQAMWVHDFESGDWIEARSATYVVDTRFTTPMGGGILASSSTERGLALAARRGGRVTDFDDAASRISSNQKKERKAP